MSNINVPQSMNQHWEVNKTNVFESRYRHDPEGRIFKFCWQPDSGEFIFDVPYTHHNQMMATYGSMTFDDYVRGICFWDQDTIYLRGHENEVWLERATEMIRAQGVSEDVQVIWGVQAAKDFEEELRFL